VDRAHRVTAQALVDLVGGRLAQIIANVADHYSGTLVYEELRFGRTLSARAAGNQRYLVL
jgi:hypothetical protein